MTPLTGAQLELRLFVAEIERRGDGLRARRAPPSAWEDHRTNMTRELWKTLDRIEPNLGLRLIASLAPGLQDIAAELAAKNAATAPEHRELRP